MPEVYKLVPHRITRTVKRKLWQLMSEAGVFMGLLNANAWATQPSFDCSKASSPDQYAICSNETLATMDIVANNGYLYLRSTLGAKEANRINRPIIQRRQACRGNDNCILRIQTESIQIFKRFGAPISLPNDPRKFSHSHCVISSGPGYKAGRWRYIVTPERFEANDNISGQVRAKFNAEARLADWTEIKVLLSNKQVAQEFFDALGIMKQQENGPCDNFFVNVDGRERSKGLRFLIARHDHLVPEDWLVLDSAGAGTLDLGRWDHPSQALIKVPASDGMKPDVLAPEREAVPMTEEGGVYVVPVKFNDIITLNAIVDSGAADVSVPADVVSTLFRTKTISDGDFIGNKTYVLADGSEVPSPQFRIRSLKVGTKTLEDVEANVSSQKGLILLGQSFLRRFKSWSVDNQQHVLRLDASDYSETEPHLPE